MNTIRLILGDQLNIRHSWFENTSQESTVYVFLEMRQETDYAPHHIQKVMGFFAAMRRFADTLRTIGFTVDYLKINDVNNRQTLGENLEFMLTKWNAAELHYQLPDEFRLDQQLKSFAESHPHIIVQAFDSEHFLTKREELKSFFNGKSRYLMEDFYRMMRRRYNILMDSNGKPTGGAWNFDKENRKKFTGGKPIPKALDFTHDLKALYDEIVRSGCKTIGEVTPESFPWPISREESLQLLEYFCRTLLSDFGNYQDAMYTGHQTLWHSRLSFSLNTKLLHPMEVIQRVQAEWESRPDEISLPQAEGFIRQILGWREYMRGIYWAEMPEYAGKNYFGASRKLPEWFWTGNTRMKCQKEAIDGSLKNAYAHHIQRLMVTGNFMMLTGIHPDEADAWYLGIYIDALQWVEITNTRGMSQFADGGIVGSKPYAGSAAYVHKMSDYCTKCHYNKDIRHGQNACPLNSLYWNFYHKNREKLEKNPRIGMMYQLLNKMSPEEISSIRKQADFYLNNIETL
jgi:deoxyribodipyrimidine photolyase-related protein